MSKHNLKMLIKFQSLWTTLLITVTEYNSNPWCSPCHILLNNNSVPLGRVTSACSSQPFREEKKSLNIGSVARNLCETSNVSWEIASSSFCLVSRFLSLGTPSLVVSLRSAGSGEEAERAEGWRRAFGSSLSFPFSNPSTALPVPLGMSWHHFTPRVAGEAEAMAPASLSVTPQPCQALLTGAPVAFFTSHVLRVYLLFFRPLTLIMMYNIPQTFPLW